MAAEQARNFGLNSLCQKRPRAVAQNLGQRIGKSPWLRELENISVGHGVSLLCWRSGGLEHPHDTPPYPFTPSPTFAHSSRRRRLGGRYNLVHRHKWTTRPELNRIAYLYLCLVCHASLLSLSTLNLPLG